MGLNEFSEGCRAVIVIVKHLVKGGDEAAPGLQDLVQDVLHL